jgi:hypothetical protein
MIGQHESGAAILRERGPFYRGVWLESLGNVRIPGPVFTVPA